MNKELWRGVYPAMLTPFQENGEIDYGMFEKNIRAQADAGVDGIIIAGSLGEASALTSTEKHSLVAFAKSVLGNSIPVIVNIAEQTTDNALAFVEGAEKAGADAFMLLPPMRYKADDREVVTYFKTIANHTSLPIMLYNNPVDYAILITLDMFEELAVCENIQAVKESSRDLTNITRMVNRFGDRYKILGGVDTLFLESLITGAGGLVGGLVDAFPRETVAIYRLIKAGNFAEAIKIYRWFMPLLELDIHPKLIQYIKLAAVSQGLCTETTRAPRLPLIGSERERILTIINDAVKTKPELPDYLNLPVNYSIL